MLWIVLTDSDHFCLRDYVALNSALKPTPEVTTDFLRSWKRYLTLLPVDRRIIARCFTQRDVDCWEVYTLIGTILPIGLPEKAGTDFDRF